MLEYDMIDVFEGIDVSKTTDSYYLSLLVLP